MLRTILQTALSLKFVPEMKIRQRDGSVSVRVPNGGGLRVFAYKIVSGHQAGEKPHLFRKFLNLLSTKLGLPLIDGSGPIARSAPANAQHDVPKLPSGPFAVTPAPFLAMPAAPKPQFMAIVLHPEDMKDASISQQVAEKVGKQIGLMGDLAGFTKANNTRPYLFLTRRGEEDVASSLYYWRPHLDRLLDLAPNAMVVPLSTEGSFGDISIPLAEFIESVEPKPDEEDDWRLGR